MCKNRREDARVTGQELDDAYANAAHIPGSEAFPPRWAAAAADFRDRLEREGRAELDCTYGAAPRERYDLFLPVSAPRGLLHFVHGGYWRAFDKSSWSHLAAGALARGWAVAMHSYTLCPEARIADITRQTAAAIAAAASRVAGPVRLVGHSAGGHQVARMLCPDACLSAAVAERLVRVVPVSGLFDLRPMLRTSMNADFRLDEDAAWQESPLACVAPLPVPVTLWVGGDERPVFVEQTREMGRVWTHADVVVEPGRHHFDVIEALAEPDAPLTEALFA